MTDYHAIYEQQARAYDRMVRAEDCDGELRRVLRELMDWSGKRVVEAGAGTGRLTRILLDAGARVLATDSSEAMLAVAREHFGRYRGDSLELAVADARSLPCASGSADVALAGWVFGHFVGWYPDAWQGQVSLALAELDRCLGPGGELLILETLGTGTEHPGPPRPELAAYYGWLETSQGMTRRQVATDYQFADPEEAAEATGFFFGAAFAERVRARGWRRIPEWTGVWHKKIPMGGRA
jgi:ubiquinone/menaquinone biosynthesis C-methylase UbiE